MTRIHKAGLLAVRGGRVLLCRKRGPMELLILPGGKFEPGESAVACLRREIAEELGPGVRVLDPVPAGRYETPAAGGGMLDLELLTGALAGEPAPAGEIAALVWFGAGDSRAWLAPSLRDIVFPDLIRRGILKWSEWEPAQPAH